MNEVLQTMGKRKTAIARATIKSGTGVVRINSALLTVHQPELARMMIEEPLMLAGEKSMKVNISVNVKGGGVMAQAQASRTAIANALVEYFKDNKLRDTFLAYDRHLLVNDTRRKEQNKPYRSAARAKRQKSKR